MCTGSLKKNLCVYIYVAAYIYGYAVSYRGLQGLKLQRSEKCGIGDSIKLPVSNLIGQITATFKWS